MSTTQISDAVPSKQDDAKIETIEQFVALERERLETLASSVRERQAELDRRESVLNARVAALETAARLHAADVLRDNERSEKIAEQEANCAKKVAELDAREAEIERLRAESEEAIRRILDVKTALDEKERQFEERSRQALETIRRQKEILLDLRREIERETAA